MSPEKRSCFSVRQILVLSAVGILSFGGGVLLTLVVVDPFGDAPLSSLGLAFVVGEGGEIREPVRLEREETPVEHSPSSPVGVDALAQISEAGGTVVPRHLLKKVDVVPFNMDGRVSAELAELFSLSEEEIRELNSRLRDLRERLDALELANVVSFEHEPQRTTINLRAFPEAGAALREDFTGFVTALLAEEGDAMIHHLLNGQLNDWGRFGEEARVIRFGVEESGLAGEIQLVYQDERVSGSGGFTMRTSVPDFHPGLPDYHPGLEIRQMAPEAEVFWPMLSEELQQLFTLGK